jgi:hypothetical protein
MILSLRKILGENKNIVFLLLALILFKLALICFQEVEVFRDKLKIKNIAADFVERMDFYKNKFHSYQSSILTTELSPCDPRRDRPITRYFRIDCPTLEYEHYVVKIIGFGPAEGVQEIYISK